MKRVVVVGGGISGLTTALHLMDRGAAVPEGVEVLVLEASSWGGGNIQTDRVDGFIIEKGPNGFLDNVPTTPALVQRLGLTDQVLKADESAARRFLYRDGRLHLLPAGPVGFLKSPVLSLPGRLRVLAEPFAPGPPEGKDESIHEFASRRIGHEAASVLVDAMVSGVFAGDVHRLSLSASFPKMAAMEEEHGGLVRALLARMRARRTARREVEERRRRGEAVEELVEPGGPAGPGGTLTSFQDGLDTLPRALVDELGGAIRLNEKVTAVERVSGVASGEWSGPGGHEAGPPEEMWRVRTEKGTEVLADAVVLALPSPNAHPVLKSLDATLAEAVQAIPTASLAVVALALDAQEMGGAPEGFGFLVPREAGLRILGCLWDSSIFPGRAPDGKVLLRTMIGGAHDPSAASDPEDSLVGRVREELRETMGLTAAPLFHRVYRWPLGIGQYTVGHLDRMGIIEGALEELGGLWVAGSSYYGISMNSCIEKAEEQVEEVLDYLGE